MNEIEQTSLNGTSGNDSNLLQKETFTPATDELSQTNAVNLISKDSNKIDLINSVSDNDDTEIEEEVNDDETCSRARAYVRGQNKTEFVSINNIPLSTATDQRKVEEISTTIKVLMPTPPEESDLPTLLPKPATPSETPTEKCDKVKVPEIPQQTELHRSSGGICDNEEVLRSPRPNHQKDESESQSPQKDETCLKLPEHLSSSISPPKTNSNTTEKSLNRITPNSETTSNESTKSGHSIISIYPKTNATRKGSNIPVGIAVAWQRLVTSSTTSSTTTHVTCVPSMSTTIKEKKTGSSKLPEKLPEFPLSPTSPIKVPQRPSSASPIARIKSPPLGKVDKNKVANHKSGSVVGSGGCGGQSDKKGHHHISKGVSTEGKSLTPDLVSSNVPNRPLPSSSVPTNLGLPYLHNGGTLMDYPYGIRSVTPFPSVNNPHHHLGHFPPSWPSTSGTDLSVSQGFHSGGSSSTAAYLQQSMHNQMQLHQHLSHHSYSNYYTSSSYLHSGYDIFRQQYEQVLLQSHQQHQQSELLRQYQHHQQQQQQQQQQQLLFSSGSGGGGGSSVGYDASRTPPTVSPRINIPILSPSPTGGGRTPTPTTFLNPSHHNLNLSNLSTTGIPGGPLPNWPTELFHHNSSATLSPKSLTSSTPSPITVQNEFSTSLNLVNTHININGGGGSKTFYGRKCATPNPTLSKSFSLNSSLVTSSCKEFSKDASQVKMEHLSMSLDKESNDKNVTHLTRDNEKRPCKHKFDSRIGELDPSHGLKQDDRCKAHNTQNPIEKYDFSSLNSDASPVSMSLSPLGHQNKHDFSRMESLIEKRTQESVHMLDHEDSKDQPSKPDLKDIYEKNSMKINKPIKKCLIKVETDLEKFDTNPVSNPALIESQMVPKDKIILDISLPLKLSQKLGNGKKSGLPKTKPETKEKATKVEKVKKEKKSLSETTAKQPKLLIDSMQQVKGKPQKKSKQLISVSTMNQIPDTKIPKKKQSEKIKDSITKPKSSRKQSKPKEKVVQKVRDEITPNTFVVNKYECENYKGNVVPESNLPVATATSTMSSVNHSYRNVEAKPIICKGEHLPLSVDNQSSPAIIPFSTPKSESQVKLPSDSNKNIKTNNKYFNPQEKVESIYTYSKDLNSNDSLRIKKEEIKDNNKIYANQSLTRDDDAKIKALAPTNKVIFTNQSMSICGGNTISLSPSSTNNSLCYDPSSNPVVPGTFLHHHNSPVTLILPRIIPQDTTINSSPSLPTSIKLIVASKDMRIPGFISSKSNQYSEGIVNPNLLLVEQPKSSGTILQNVNLVASSVNASLSTTSSSSSSLNVNSCDSESTSPNNPKYTFISNSKSLGGESYFKNQPLYQVNQITLPQVLQLNPIPEAKHTITSVKQDMQNTSKETINNNNNNLNITSICVRKDFIEPADNHLDLLATVAQEFGSRDDLGKLVSSSGNNFLSQCPNSISSYSGSSRGSSLMTSPVHSMQSPEGLSSFSLYPPNSQSFSLPTSPVPLMKSTSSLINEYEFHDTDKESNNQPVSTLEQESINKQTVWLKIPHVIPKAAAKVAEQLLKKKEKQEKAAKKKAMNKKLNKDVKDIKDSSKTKDNTKQIKSYSSGNDSKLIEVVPKLKIPKITQSLVKQTNKKDHKLSEKMKKARRKSHDSFLSSNHSKNNVKVSEPTSMKMKLSLPKVAKIRIRLSETEDPVLMTQSVNNEISNDNGNLKKDKIKRRHSDGDKLSRKKKIQTFSGDANSSIKSLSFIGQNRMEHKDSNRKRKHSHHSFRSAKEEVPAKVSKLITKAARKEVFDSKIGFQTTSLPAQDLSSNFTSSTSPPTAKLLHVSKESSQGSSHSIFSPSNLKSDNDSNTETENENENDFNWVSDPTFAASAIRLSNTSNQSFLGDTATKDSINVNATGGESLDFSRELFDKKDKRKSNKPSKLSLLNFNNDKVQQMDNEESNIKEKDIKSQLKSFVHFAPKVKASSLRHIKPCLKAEPIIRPSISSSSEDESENEVDLEVATLTNSLSSPTNTPFRSPFKRSIKTYSREANNNKSSQIKHGGSQESGCKKRRPSLTYSNPRKHVSRRHSINVEIGQNHVKLDDEEELPDIPEDFSYYPHKSLHRRSSQSSEYDNKLGNGSKHVKGMSSSSTPSFNNSSSKMSKRSPKKRSSRSSTTTSNSDKQGISSLGSSASNKFATAGVKDEDSRADVIEDETLLPGKIELESVVELLDEMRILTEIQGLFYTGKLNALQPPDVYGVTLDNERGAPPHLIFSAEEVLEKCIREKKPKSLTVGLRICAYWSPQYSGLYPGRVSTDFNPLFDPEKDLIPIEFDDGDTGMIKLGEIRLLPPTHPIREYDPNPLLTLEKKHRKRRHSSANTNSGPCTGEHEEADCGESFCAKVGKFEEEDDEYKDKHHSYKSLYWTWTGLGFKKPKSKKDRNKEFFRGIQRGDEIINVGDSAIFISHGNERPYIGRIEKFWEKKGQKVVNVRWFYHPEEVKSPKRIPHLKHPGALFESPHIDENDVQTIGQKCDVLPFPEFKERIGKMPKLSLKNSNTTKPKDLYYVAGYYDPYTYNLKLKI